MLKVSKIKFNASAAICTFYNSQQRSCGGISRWIYVFWHQQFDFKIIFSYFLSRLNCSCTLAAWWPVLSLEVTTLSPEIIMSGMVILNLFSFLFQHFLLLNLLTEYSEWGVVILTSTAELYSQSCLSASTWCIGWFTSVSLVIFQMT